MATQHHIRQLLAAAALLCCIGSTRAHPEKCEQPPTIRFSLIPVGDIERRIRAYRPLFKRLEALTGRPVTVIRPSSYSTVVEGLLAGSIDIAALGPATYAEAKRSDANVTAFATIEKRGGTFQPAGPFYRSLLVTRADSPFADIPALKGAHLALTDPGSTSGSLFPRAQFAPLLGLPLERYFGKLSYTGNHAKSVQALADGAVDAAFISSTEVEEAHVSGKLPAERIRVLWQSGPIPYDPFVYRGQLCEPLRGRIRAAFLDAAAEPQLHSLLKDLKAARFIPIDDSKYAGIRKLLE
jgi:phosphonate transport system substrate-binding protein